MVAGPGHGAAVDLARGPAMGKAAASEAFAVRQLNPRRDFDLSKRKWSRAYRIAETRHRG